MALGYNINRKSFSRIRLRFAIVHLIETPSRNINRYWCRIRHRARSLRSSRLGLPLRSSKYMSSLMCPAASILPSSNGWRANAVLSFFCSRNQPMKNCVQICFLLSWYSIAAHLPVGNVFQIHCFDQLVHTDYIGKIWFVAENQQGDSFKDGFLEKVMKLIFSYRERFGVGGINNKSVYPHQRMINKIRMYVEILHYGVHTPTIAFPHWAKTGLAAEIPTAT